MHFVVRSVIRRSPLLLALVVAIATARAQAPAAAVDSSASATEAARLSRALETVRADEITADVFFIAADELGGRDTPSNGQRVAARFLRNRLQRLGWQPGAPEKSFLYEYSLVNRHIAEPATHAVASHGDEKLELHFGSDYFFYDLEEAERSGDVVFCGTGSAQDFRTTAVEGRWALVFEGDKRDSELGKRAQSAKALGLLVAAPLDSSQREFAQRFAPWITRMRRDVVEFPETAERAGGGRGSVARLTISDAARDKLLELAGLSKPEVGDDLRVTLAETRKLAADSRIACEDVCGFWPGSDPELSQEVILCSAHYDHLGTSSEGVVYNGADDNGSGTCGLLALAEALASYGPMRRSVMLVWVSGEEKGLYGSRAWTDKPYFPNGGKAIADINMDMIGRMAGNQILITPTSKHKAYNGLTKLAETFFPTEGFTDIKSADEFYTRSDHYMFAKLGIPITFLFDGMQGSESDYHRPTDKPEKIDGDKIRRVVRVFVRMLDAMQTDRLDLTVPSASTEKPQGGGGGSR